MKSVFYKRILLPTQDLTASVSSQQTTPTPTNPVAVSYTICGNYKLYGLTNYLDTFNATTKVITHKIGIKVLDGTENWNYDQTWSRFFMVLSGLTSQAETPRIVRGFSTHYEWIYDGRSISSATAGQGYFAYIGGGDSGAYLHDSHTSVDTWKSWLAQQYANGTPVIIYYPLATETTETATEPLQRVETKSFVQYKANPEYRNLPSGYTQVKYLQSSGTQYIDTCYLPELCTRFIIDAEFTNISRGRFGSYGNNSDGIRFYFGVVSSKWAVGYGSDTEYNHSVGDADTNRHTFEINDTDFIIDCSSALSFRRHWHSIIGNILLFARSDGQSLTDYASAKLYSSKIYNDTLVRDFVPCYNSNNVAGMYDKSWDNTKCGVVDLGTLTWTKNTSYDTIRFLSNTVDDCKIPTDNSTPANIYTSKYTNYGTNQLIGGTMNGISFSNGHMFSIRDSELTSLTAEQFKERMSGVLVYYQRTTDTTWQPPFYTNSGTGTFIVGEDVPQFIRVDEKDFVLYHTNNALCLTSLQDNSTVGYSITGTVDTSGIQYSRNMGRTWNAWNGTAISLNNGQKMYVRNTNNTLSTTYSDYFKFTMTGVISASGNIMSMINYSNITDRCFNKLFQNCTSLITPPQLPATTLAEGCYNAMFQGCSSLTTAPELPATTLAEGCYNAMFYDCSSLNVSDTQTAEAPYEWRIPNENTATSGSTMQGIFVNCAGTRSSDNMQITAGSYKVYYTQHEPI